MREYRGKRVDTGEWIYGWYGVLGKDTDIEKHVIMISMLNTSSYANYFYFTDHEVDPKTVGQHTGYKGIHQGDIVEVEHDEIGSPIPPDYIGEVKYMEYGYYVVNNKRKMAFPLYQEIAEWEKVGNIHDNPELLKGDEGE